MHYNFFLRICLSLFLILIGLKAVCASNTVPFTDPEKPILVEKKQAQFTIRLSSNPGSTGYAWYLSHYDSRLLTLIQHTYQTPTRTMPGASGIESWTFKVNDLGFIAPQITKISLVHARPWDLKDNSKQVEFTIITH